MDQIKEELTRQLQSHTAFTIPLFGGIPVAQSVVVTWLVMAALTALAVLLTRRLRQTPGRAQALVELFVELIDKFVRESAGEHARVFAPFIGTVALYIGVANMAGLFGFPPPTKDVNVTAALALMSVCLIYGGSFYCKGLRGGLHKFIEPMPAMLPINLLEIGIRPLSLCMRLFGNVLGAFVVMELIKCVAPFLVPLPFSLYFDLFDGLIQTIVFVFLTTLFLGEAVE